jgi:hypothetical protein
MRKNADSRGEKLIKELRPLKCFVRALVLESVEYEHAYEYDVISSNQLELDAGYDHAGPRVGCNRAAVDVAEP